MPGPPYGRCFSKAFLFLPTAPLAAVSRARSRPKTPPTPFQMVQDILGVARWECGVGRRGEGNGLESLLDCSSTEHRLAQAAPSLNTRSHHIIQCVRTTDLGSCMYLLPDGRIFGKDWRGGMVCLARSVLLCHDGQTRRAGQWWQGVGQQQADWAFGKTRVSITSVDPWNSAWFRSWYFVPREAMTICPRAPSRDMPDKNGRCDFERPARGSEPPVGAQSIWSRAGMGWV